jgi:hypothetical protein
MLTNKFYRQQQSLAAPSTRCAVFRAKFGRYTVKLMHTFFNQKIKETNDDMRLVLHSHAETFLKDHGCYGK